MKVILDPLVFWLPSDHNVQESDVKDALRSIDDAVNMVRRGHMLVSTSDLWDRMNRELVLRLAKMVPSKDLYPKISFIRSRIQFFEAPLKNTETWGIRNLFEFFELPDPENWMTSLARVAAHWINENEDFALMTRLLDNRNIRRHTGGTHCVIVEKTHWKIYIQPADVANRSSIRCISNVRNIDVPWTARYDDQLPENAPLHGLAFIPDPDWNDEVTVVVRTVRSKPTWVDADGNGWSDTNTPGIAHHWDVFLNQDSLRTKFGADYVNITRHGTSDRDRAPGEVHH